MYLYLETCQILPQDFEIKYHKLFNLKKILCSVTCIYTILFKKNQKYFLSSKISQIFGTLKDKNLAHIGRLNPAYFNISTE